MFHRTTLARNPNELTGIVDLQVRLLRLAASTDRIDKDALDRWFKDAELVTYLTRNWPHMIGALKDFARDCPHNEKTVLIDEVIAEIQHDADFWKRYADPGFVLKFSATNQHRQRIAEWLKGFYEQFSKSGFDTFVTAGPPWNKSEWEKAFRKNNPSVKTCPQCDATMTSGFTAEHVFPREKYPSLSVHVANLVPCCKDCQEWKKNEDPIAKSPPKKLFLPYWQHAIEHCEVRVAPRASGDWQFALASSESDNDWREAIQQLSRLYGVPDRWNKQAQSIVDLAIAKIEEKIAADRDDGRSVTSETEFRERLGKLSLTMQSQWGRQHYFVPATAWITWAKDNMLDRLWSQFGG